MWWKQHKWKVILPVLILAVLAGAFWYGGNAPGARGWTVQIHETSQPALGKDPQDAAEPVQTQEPSADPKPEETAEEHTPKPDAKEEPTEGAPKQTAVPSASKQPEQPQSTDQPEMVIGPETGKDQYLTDPVPEGKPLPVEPQEVTIGTTAYSCTISISCATILDNLDLCDPEKKELVPEDGWILEPVTVTFYEGESVFNVLQRTCKQKKIHMEFEDTPMYNSAYIEGIHNLYEFDVGELSGWMYSVNGWFPNYGCSRYQLRDGDVVEWVYTCDLGADVGRGLTESRGAN
ncbi:MAG: DUF4430 domain-containing protein [Clostridiales bacterium]|uniref:DUF4430 domain-containing protein n=1 Tax=Flavonifractor porci TaxID=3133422 RepID=UPI0030B33622|nr:DUF4430 domain-containing protein [Clostridiales bacterium]